MGFWHVYFGLYGAGGTQPDPDFMHGSLRTIPHLVGDIQLGSALGGNVNIRLALVGKVETNP